MSDSLLLALRQDILLAGWPDQHYTSELIVMSPKMSQQILHRGVDAISHRLPINGPARSQVGWVTTYSGIS
jgi:hypothetical protein